MKKKILRPALLIFAAAVVLVGAYTVGTGFRKATDIILYDYDITPDGNTVYLRVETSSSVGSTRGFKNSGGGVKSHYLTFYSAFGGINGTLGASSSFKLALSPDDTEIYFNRPNGGFELVLQKNTETGEWARP